jgi:hypothetical protein
MYCPKCGGGAFVSDEELLKVMETLKPMKMILKQTFVCRACTERFSRVVWDDLESRRKGADSNAPPPTGMEMFSVAEKGSSKSSDDDEEEAGAGIKFLDKI